MLSSHVFAIAKHVHQNSYRLHAIILSRSPFLAHLMSTSPQSGGQRSIYVHLEHEPEVTQEVSINFSGLASLLRVQARVIFGLNRTTKRICHIILRDHVAT
jgi:hypothetical protein